MRRDGWDSISSLFMRCGKTASYTAITTGRKDAGRRGGATTLLSLRCVARQLDSHYKQAARMRGDGAGLPLSSLYGVWQGSYTAITSRPQGCGRRGGATTLLSLPCVARQLDSHYKQAVRMRGDGAGLHSPLFTVCGKAARQPLQRAARMRGDGAGLPLSSLYGVWQGSYTAITSRPQGCGRRGRATLSSLYGVWQGSYTAITSRPQGCGRRGGATTLLSLRCVARQLYSHYKQAARMWGDGAGLPLSSLYGVWQGSYTAITSRPQGCGETGRGYHSPLFTVCGKAARQPLQAGRKDVGRRGGATTLLSLRCVARQLDSHYKQAARMQGDGAGLPLSSLYGVWQGSYTAITSRPQGCGETGQGYTLLSLRCVARQLYSHYKQAARMRGDGAGLHSPLFTVCGKAAIQPLQAGRKDAGDGAGLPLSSLYGVWQGS